MQPRSHQGMRAGQCRIFTVSAADKAQRGLPGGCLWRAVAGQALNRACFRQRRPWRGFRRSEGITPAKNGQRASSTSRNARGVTMRIVRCWPRSRRSRSPVTIQPAPAAKAAAMT